METVLRVSLFYIVILVGLRLLGKREFAQLTPLELVSLLLIPEIVSQSIVREDFSAVNGLIGLSTLFCLVFLNSFLTYRFRNFEKVIGGVPTVLVKDGKYLPANLAQERITPDEILDQVRKSGYENLEEVRWAILEGDGRISIVPVVKGGGTADAGEEQPVK